LGAKNLDLLVLLIKNWPNTSGFEEKIEVVHLGGFDEVEEHILDVIDFEFPHEVDGHVEECIQDWDMYP
jgi:hypothetical protein